MGNEPEITKPRIEYLIDTYIPPECLEGGECQHDHKEKKKHYNPI